MRGLRLRWERSFRAPLVEEGSVLEDTAQDLSDLFNQNDAVLDFDTWWDQILFGTGEIPQENVLEGFVQEQITWIWTTADSICYVQSRIASRSHDVKLSKIEENGEAKYWLIHQNAELQSSKWKNWDRSIGQESKRKMSVLKEKCETAFNGRADEVQKRILLVSLTDLILVNEHNVLFHCESIDTHWRKKLSHELPTQSPSKSKGESPSGLKDKRQCKNILTGTRAESSCDFWHLPVRLRHKSESRCKYDDKCIFQHNEPNGQSSKKSKNGCAKGSATLLKETIQECCVSQDSTQRKSLLRGNGSRITQSSSRRPTCVA